MPILVGAVWLKHIGAATAECVPYDLQAYIYKKNANENKMLPECRPDTCVDEMPFDFIKVERYSKVQEEVIIVLQECLVQIYEYKRSHNTQVLWCVL